MLWLLQNNYVSRLTAPVAMALRAHDRSFHDFSVVPGQPLPAFPVSSNAPHFVYGSTGLVRRLQELDGWRDALFLDERSLDQREWLLRRPNDMLNGESQVLPLQALTQDCPTTPFFVRPVELQKAFVGQVVLNGNLEPLFESRTHGVAHRREQPLDMLVSVSPVQNIRAEFRCLLYRGALVTASQYRENGTHAIRAGLPASVASGVQALAEGWLPSELTVMDVALLADDTLRIVEFNSVHSSGLYAMPLALFIDAVEQAVRDRFV